MRKKKLLFMEDLLQLFRENGLTKFSSSDSGYRLCVQVPATFEVEDKVDDDHRGMMRLKIRVFHLDANRNGSFVSKKAAKDAMPTIKNRPVMAYIHQRDDGEWDFEAHNMTVETDENGNNYFEYQEKQVGSFDESEPFFEYDKELDKTYVCAYAYISEDYTRACDIIRRKGGTKNSVELSIEELAYNSKEGYLELQKFYVSASTLLGSYDDGTEIAEGMLGSRADIVDFSEKNNSVLSDRQELIDEVTTAVIKQLSDIKAFAENSKEGGKPKEMDKFNELLAKYNKTVDDITFDYNDMSDEELEVAFADAFEIADSSEDSSSEENEKSAEEESPVIETEASEEEVTDEAADGTPEVVNESVNEFADDDPPEDTTEDDHQSTSAIEDEDSTETTIKIVNIVVGEKTFELSLDDVNYSINCLVNDMYSETDNTYYMTVVYPESKHIVMIDAWNSSRAFKQSYKDRKGVYSLIGERIPVRSIWVTSDEEAELDKMRSNYSSIESELNSYKDKELHSQRDSVLASEDYSVMGDFADFKDLKSHMDEYSLEDLTNKADLIYAKFMKSNYSTFSAKPEKKRSMVFMTSGSNNEEERLPYGGLFKNFKNKK